MQILDDGHMQQALRLAAEGRGLTSPNPMVGAVVVAGDGTVVGTGYHERAGGDHAEVLTIRDWALNFHKIHENNTIPPSPLMAFQNLATENQCFFLVCQKSP